MRRLLLCYHQDGYVEPEAERLFGYLSRLLPSGVGRLAAAAIADERDVRDAWAAPESVDAVVVIVGTTWAQRVGDPRDAVRRAVEDALARGIPVVPVAAAGSYIPSVHELPRTLEPFAELAPVQVAYREGATSNAQLLERLRSEMGGRPGDRSNESEPAAPIAPTSGALRVTPESQVPEPSPPRVRGIGSGVTAFVGPTLRSPTHHANWPVRSFEDFQRDFGGAAASGEAIGHVALAAKSYFENGGGLLYVSRVLGEDAAPARATIAGLEGARFEYRSPGGIGNGEIAVTRVTTPATGRTMLGAPEGTAIEAAASPGQIHVKRGGNWEDRAGEKLDASVTEPEDWQNAPTCSFVTLSVETRDSAGRERQYDELALSPLHSRWIGHIMAQYPTTWSDADNFAIVLDPNVSPFDLDRAFFASAQRDEQGRPTQRYLAAGGTDGAVSASAYATALQALEEIEDVEVVAAPGYGALPNREYGWVEDALVVHAERCQRLAVLELPPQCTPEQARALRARVDSTRAALFFPWVIGADGDAAEGRLLLPPTGFVCGILARTSVSVGAPRPLTNEKLRGALRPEHSLGPAEENELVPLGINCVRWFPGSGCLLRGGRLACSNATWRFVNLRRYIDYVGGSIARGMGWALFENNDERTWTQLREIVSDFLREEWRCGRLLGSVESEAFFVRCGADTMTEADVANGRLVCSVGFAASSDAPCRLDITAGETDEPLFREHGLY